MLQMKLVIRWLTTGLILAAITNPLDATLNAPLDPSLYMDSGLDILVEPLQSKDLIYPAQLSEIVGHYRSGKYRLAILKLTKVDSMNVPDGNRDIVLLMLGESHRKLGLQMSAAQYYREVALDYTDSPYRVFAVYRLQDHYYRQKEYERSDSLGETFKKQYRKHRLYPASLYLHGKSLIRQEKYREASNVLESIPKGNEFYIPGAFLNGLCHVVVSNMTKALAFLDYVASAAGPGAMADEARLLEGDLYFRMQKYEASLRMYSNVSMDINRADYVLMRRANLYKEMGKLKRAVSLAREVLHDHPHSEYIFEACLLLERCYRELGDDVNGDRIQLYADTYARNYRFLFLIASELQRLKDLEIAWDNLARRLTLRSKKEAGEVTKLAKREIKKSKQLEKKLRKLQEGIDPTGKRRTYMGNVGLAEQTYLEILGKEMSRYRPDSIDFSQSMESTQKAMDSQKDSVRLKRLDATLQELNQKFVAVQAKLRDLRETHQILIDECFAGSLIDRFTEDLQAKFVDWGMLRNQSIERDIQQQSQVLVAEQKRIREWKQRLAKQQKSKKQATSKGNGESGKHDTPEKPDADDKQGLSEKQGTSEQMPPMKQQKSDSTAQQKPAPKGKDDKE